MEPVQRRQHHERRADLGKPRLRLGRGRPDADPVGEDPRQPGGQGGGGAGCLALFPQHQQSLGPIDQGSHRTGPHRAAGGQGQHPGDHAPDGGGAGFGVGQHGKLDALTVSMAHPDATAALLSGRSEVTAHFTTPPFQYQQLENPAVHRVLSSYDILGGPHTLNLIYTTGKFATKNPKTTRAFLTALETADDWIKQNPKAAAELYVRAENSKLKPDFVEGMITDPDVHFTTVPENIMKFAEFQHRTGQIKVKPTDWKEIFLADAHGYQGS